MKQLLSICLFFISSWSLCSQVELSDSDLNKLVQIGEYYSSNVMLSKSSVMKDLEEFRSDKLNNVVDMLQTMSKNSKDILDDKFLSKPSFNDLKLWYVIREIHYNRTDKENEPRPSKDVAIEVLKDDIDQRWLLANYYYRLKSSLAMLFNEDDLSGFNFDFESYNLESNTEKAILFFNVIDALATRYRVLSTVKNYEKLIEFNAKMPKFNGKDYFYYTNFEYDDFDWIGYKEIESYNKRQIGMLYEILGAHLSADDKVNKGSNLNEIYNNSILSKPRYFKYSSSEKELKKIYKKRN